MPKLAGSEDEKLATPPKQETLEERKRKIRLIGDSARASFSDTHGGRERGLRLSREIIRNSANSIRSTHRREFDQARDLVGTVAGLVEEMERSLEGEPAVYYAGFIQDAHKEYAEAAATLAFAEGTPLPGPKELKIEPAPYLNGLAESVGELRRFILDSLRKDDCSVCEGLLETMDEVYSVLVSVDYPEAVTRGLRRSTDMVRGVLERTRGDLTLALRQRRLEQTLAAFGESRPDSGA